MRGLLKKQFLNLCCYMLTASIVFSPLGHASYMAMLESDSEHVMPTNQQDRSHSGHAESSEPCHQQQLLTDTAVSSSENESDELESCDHDNMLTCKILCSVSISAIPNAPVSFSAEYTSTWLAFSETQNFQSLPLSFFKPPKI